MIENVSIQKHYRRCVVFEDDNDYDNMILMECKTFWPADVLARTFWPGIFFR